VGRIALRLSAGFSIDETVAALADEPEKFRHNVVPNRGISKAWVLSRMRDLRREIQETSGES